MVSLAGRVGHRRKAVGEIEELVQLPGQPRAEGRRSASRTAGPATRRASSPSSPSRRDEGAHPFTISSGWQGDGRLFFLIKGSATTPPACPRLLQVGDLVHGRGALWPLRLRQPRQRRQIWVGGGIGITPFIARMKALAQ